MSALGVSHEPPPCWDEAVRLWEEMEWPEGSRVEIIEGIVTVAPPPSNPHNVIVELVQQHLYEAVPKDRDWGIYQTLGVASPSRGNLCIPDLLVVPREVPRTQGSYIPAGAAELVVEVTSRGNAAHDRLNKAAGYAQAGVPLYLLIDAWAPRGPALILYGEPQADTYRTLQTGKFGEPFPLPEPFDCVLSTERFPTG
ncbi:MULTISPECIES: Uma2 family endonuclease [Streptomyces]|uniref:Uma2 family endonuclease n=1 Tax=Streptomyces chilikensis TaxID=1194079 RepID=A0ABV3EXE6_9ACTN|nr:MULTISPECIES: Uma2 family endonuclease [Streptomyces]MDH6225379.1 Uma2 family endonuclease [Streptomyces sp. MJP52]